MKRFLAIFLAVIMVFALAACGKGKTEEPAKDGGTTPPAESSDPSGTPALTEEDLAEADEAWSRLEDMFYAEDWKWDKADDSGYINGKWDEGVMYDPVPSPPEGIIVDEMQYNGKKSQRYGGDYATIGQMDIDSAQYEAIYVDFNCTRAQLDEMIQSFKDSGWLMIYEEDYGNGDMWHFFYGSEYYAYLRAAEYLASDGAELGGVLDVLPAYYALPASVAGVPLPQCGILMSPGWMDGCDEDWNYIEEELSVDTPAAQLPPYWSYGNEGYRGVSVDDIKAYADSLVADGWEITNEYYAGESDYDPAAYSVSLKKGEMRVNCSGSYGASLGISVSNNENMAY